MHNNQLNNYFFYITLHFRRLSAVGCECGYLRLCKVDVKTNKIIYNLSTRFVSTIINVRFQIENKHKLKKTVSLILERETCETNDDNCTINLVVLNSILPAVYFK